MDSTNVNKHSELKWAAEHRGRIPVSHPAAPGLIPSVPNVVSENKIIDVAEVNQLH